MMTEAQKKKSIAESQRKYQAKAYRQFNVKLHKSIDADVIEFLENIPNLRQYLISHVRNSQAVKMEKE